MPWQNFKQILPAQVTFQNLESRCDLQDNLGFHITPHINLPCTLQSINLKLSDTFVVGGLLGDCLVTTLVTTIFM